MSYDIKKLTIKGIEDGIAKKERRMRNEIDRKVEETRRKAVKQANEDAQIRIANAKEDMDRKIQDSNRNLKDFVKKSQRDLNCKIDNVSEELLKNIEEQDRQQSAALKELSDNIYDDMNKYRAEIDQQMGKINKNIDSLDKNIKQVNSNLQNLAQSVDNRFNAQQSQINDISGKVDSLYADKKNIEDYKRQKLAIAQGLISTVCNRTPVARFAPDALQEVRIAERNLVNSINNPLDSTISDVNQLIRDTMKMEREANKEYLKWKALHDLATSSVQSLITSMQDNMKITAPGVYDESQVEELQVDYWSHGRYNNLINEAKSLKARLETEPSTPEIEGIIKQTAELEFATQDILKECVELGILSENRVMVINDVLNSLVDEGWEIKQRNNEDDLGYMGGEEECDMREGTYAILKNANTGEELTILISLEDEGDSDVKQNKIIFHRNDNRITSPGAFMTRVSQIKRQIELSGHKLGELSEPACGGDGKIPQLTNGSSLSQKGATETLNERMRTRR